MILRVLVLVLMAAGAAAQDYTFEWQGAGGYSMRGSVSFEAERAKGFLTEAHVQCFEIEGFHNFQPIGRWALGMATDETTWLLEFDTGSASFLTPHSRNSMPQAWNMTGLGDGCGEGGFGFNLGSAAQDICIDDRLIVDSQVAPSTPFAATRVDDHQFSSDACPGAQVMSRR